MSIYLLDVACDNICEMVHHVKKIAEGSNRTTAYGD